MQKIESGVVKTRALTFKDNRKGDILILVFLFVFFLSDVNVRSKYLN